MLFYRIKQPIIIAQYLPPSLELISLSLSTPPPPSPPLYSQASQSSRALLLMLPSEQFPLSCHFISHNHSLILPTYSILIKPLHEKNDTLMRVMIIRFRLHEAKVRI
ncbi:hypothetical protein ABW21_db0204774 [Orbilia brochopaga]|nr:hypothetical protein ABW21_db0204774 [Drechslerella brochopaga]